MPRRLKLAKGVEPKLRPGLSQPIDISQRFARARAMAAETPGARQTPRNGSDNPTVFTGEKQSRGKATAGRALGSCAPCPPPPRQNTRGGARNFRSRWSDRLTPQQVDNIIAAAWFALAVGLPLNRFTTVHWEQGGVVDDLAALRRLLKLMADWLRLHGVALTCVWVRESGRGKGAHVHLLFHLPPGLASAFNAMMRRWRKRCGLAWAARVIKSRPVGRSLRHALAGWAYGEPYAPCLAGAVEYLVKGSDRDTLQQRGITRWASGGEVYGKRCGTSQNVGSKARSLGPAP